MNSSVRVLLVEDNKTTQIVTKSVLEILGFNVSIAASAQEALNKFLSYKPTMILMDIGLPGKINGKNADGVDATRYIRQSSVLGKRVPIIAVTAHADEKNSQHFYKAGIDKIVPKPITISVLKELSNTFIKKDKE